MDRVFSFAPVANKNAQVLILGSMPGIASLEVSQYYAHPRNSFWYIMSQLFGFDQAISYEQRINALVKNNVAVWDVLKACVREGSLDSSIKTETIEANDFKQFFSEHPNISNVYFNGARAEQEFQRHVLAKHGDDMKSISFARLPSTSPAHAAMSREEKYRAWQVISRAL